MRSVPFSRSDYRPVVLVLDFIWDHCYTSVWLECLSARMCQSYLFVLEYVNLPAKIFAQHDLLFVFKLENDQREY